MHVRIMQLADEIKADSFLDGKLKQQYADARVELEQV